ncbi:hypothetical protein [Streptomyces ipomoeae]|nr:hypothetical protein [Streptomyces ipomoeae]MDX2694585.1 hypothetical protein [Streptomyces ipomoeae]MDX2837805.1 hypothetical protein [Streptomyces ipomoeae]
MFAVINFTVVILSQDTKIGYGLSAFEASLLYLTPAAIIGVFATPLSGWPANRTGWTLLRAGLGAEALHREPQLPSPVRDITPMGGAAHCRVVLEADPGSGDHLIERLRTL